MYQQGVKPVDVSLTKLHQAVKSCHKKKSFFSAPNQLRGQILGSDEPTWRCGGGIDFITLLAHALRKIFTSYRLAQVTFPVRRAHTNSHTSCLSYFPFSFAKQNPFGWVLNFSSQHLRQEFLS